MMTLNNKKRKKPPKRATFYFSIKSIVNIYILIVGDYASMAYTKAGARATAKHKTKRLETVKACQALSYARQYIKKFVNDEGLVELEELIKARREQLHNRQ